MALHKLTCILVRIVITTMKTKMKPKRSLNAVFKCDTPEPHLQGYWMRATPECNTGNNLLPMRCQQAEAANRGNDVNHFANLRALNDLQRHCIFLRFKLLENSFLHRNTTSAISSRVNFSSGERGGTYYTRDTL